MDEFGIQKAHIIGHDWGAAVAWAFAALYPERTLNLTAVSVGHPSNYMSGSHLGEQRQKSWCVSCMISRRLVQNSCANQSTARRNSHPPWPNPAVVHRSLVLPDNFTTPEPEQDRSTKYYQTACHLAEECMAMFGACLLA